MGGSKLKCQAFLIVDQSSQSPTCFAECRRNRSRSTGFLILDIMSRSEDIRNQSRKCVKSHQILHVFGPQIVLGERPQIFGLALSNRRI